ncbi:hypothetical protein HYC85_012653 [Camellia sinensis]|uniref:Cupin type-1 domain-containing protein n=1 Tax=Camellia sinensis TaxID=4442 RepID=A0A7J7HCK5_CAMSI|nr:hypothetical protein HYC85_012653 [Camellia sinensis]
MGCTSLLFLGLGLLVLFHGCFAQLEQIEQQQDEYQFLGLRGAQQQPQHRLRARTDCQIQKLNALEPNRRLEAEAGLTEIWDQNNDELECAGRGQQGTAIPGCPESFESTSSTSESGDEERQRRRDRHQKVRAIREGDVIAVPAGVTHWAYNDGEIPLVCISLLDMGNDANQLDLNFRKFFLAGNPQRQQQSLSRQEPRRGQQEDAGNVFDGIDEDTLAEVFKIDRETARNLQGRDDQRGIILSKLKEISRSTRADVYNPRGGRISTLNGHDLPILNALRLSAERGFLYQNAIMAPHWNVNAHSIIYIIRGSGRIQVAGNAGRSMFDGQVQEGQLIVIPQNFALLKKASSQGLEWIAFKTNDNAITSPLAGRLSAIRSMPEEVLMNSYDISREEARNLKFNREELTVFGPGSRSQRANKEKKA